jgi:isopenicillin N synthase-like dioxygenase
MTITGLPTDIRIDAPSRHRILRLFNAPRAVIEGLAGNTRDPSCPLVYHGWFPSQSECLFWCEAFQIGADVPRDDYTVDPGDPLTGATPMPAEAVIPGWGEAVRAHFLGMERVATGVLQCIARRLRLSGDGFTGAFTGGASSMRLLRYPLCPANANCTSALVAHDSEQRMIISESHFDFGCLTLLVQDEAPGLQVRLRGGAWADILPREGHVVVICGRLLELWTSGRVVACEHRVLSPNR